jgi:hypothetical protein
MKQSLLTFLQKKSLAYMIFQWFNDLSDNVNYIFIVAYAIYLVMHGKILPEQLVEFWLYQTSIAGYLYVSRFFQLFSIQPSVVELSSFKMKFAPFAPAPSARTFLSWRKIPYAMFYIKI